MDIIKVISLKRSTGRRDEFTKMNPQLKFEFVDAIDGSELTRESIAKTNLFHQELPYTSGAYGCALSHLSLWEEAIKFSKVMTVAEDDAIFRLDFEEQYSQLLREISPDWDIILWGWNFDSILSLYAMPNISSTVMLFNEVQLRNSIYNFQRFQEKPNLIRLDKCFGTPAYSISPNGAKKFKSLCFPITKFNLFFPVLNREFPNNGIDMAMNRIYQVTNSLVCFSPLVITKNDRSKSTVQNNSL